MTKRTILIVVGIVAVGISLVITSVVLFANTATRTGTATNSSSSSFSYSNSFSINTRLVSEDEYGFMIPAGWRKTDHKAIKGYGVKTLLQPNLSANNPRVSLNIIVQYAGDRTLEEYTKLSIEQINGGELIEGAKVYSTAPIRLGGQPGMSAVYGTGELKILAYWTLKDNRAIIITYGGPISEFDEYAPVMSDIRDTFYLK
jgi:hypothetical protein